LPTTQNIALRIIIIAAIAVLVWLGVQTYVIHSYGFNWFIALADALCNTVLLSFACWLINNNLRYYQPGTKGYTNLLVWCAVLAVLSMVATKWLMPLLVDNVQYQSFVTQGIIIRFALNFLAIGVVAIISMLWYTTIDQNETARRKSDAEKLAREAELYNLRQQLQPHFLFNSLNSINALIGLRPDEARKMIHQLSDFLRGTLRKDDQLPVPLADELQHLQLYLDIEKVRFGHRLLPEISCDDKCEQLLVPPMLLQPIVENSIKFGLYDTTGDVTISVRAEVAEGYLHLMVQNPYDPQTARPRQGTGFGLSGVQRRLYLLYARNDLLETFADGETFTTTIKVPQ
jgi:two-component system LytT family sensor kinase